MFFIKSKYEKNLSKQERIECLEQMLTQDFPLILFSISAFLNIIFGILAIGFEITSLVLKSPLYYVGTG